MHYELVGNTTGLYNLTLLVFSRRDEVRVRYSFFSEVVMVTFESDDDTRVVLVVSLVGVMASLGVFAGFGPIVLSLLSAALSAVLSAALSVDFPPVALSVVLSLPLSELLSEAWR